ncbi:pilus biogenesis protein [Deltaproteobacteria bacterium]|nr:pilus biogenesis protein [Deltaproteobacteria bacterium]
MSQSVLLDTGVIVALLDRSERRHADCARAIQGLGATLITCEAVLAEACYLLRGVQGASAAVLANVGKGTFQIPFHLASEAGDVATLMERYADVPMDLADASLVRLAELVDTPRILTLDADFRTYRWQRRRVFDLLVEPGT